MPVRTVPATLPQSTGVRQLLEGENIFLLDHLPRMTLGSSPIRVRWLGAEYEGISGQFLDYPATWGFSIDSLLLGDFGAHGPQQGLAFLQAWLFLGLLKEALGNENRVVPQHWIGNYTNTQVTKKYMISPYLRIYLVKIDRRLRDPRQLRPPWEYWEEVFGLTTAVAEAFDKRFARRCSRENVAEHEPLQIMWSILMLGQILTSTIMRCYQVEVSDLKHWPDGSILHMRLSRQLECPHRCNKLMALFAMDAIYLLTLLSIPGSISRYASLPAETNDIPISSLSLYDEDPGVGRGRHRHCTLQRCLGEKIDESSYRTAHTRDDCECDFGGPDIRKVIQILDDAEVPAFVVREYPSSTGGPSRVSIDVVRTTVRSDYVAISHVWADGLGNKSDNRLPRCQILRIARLVCALTGCEGQPFWIDTFGILRDLEQRKKGLAVMNATYRLAAKVLVLDGGLQQHTSYPTFENELAGIDAVKAENIRVGVALELLLQVICCSWTSRLWTLPEGMLGPELHFQFSDGTIELGDLIAQIRPWPFIGTTVVADILSSLIRLRPKLRTQTRRNQAPIDPFMSRWPGGDPYGQFITTFHALEFRDTTRKEDEATCLGIHLNLNLEAILSRPYPERLQALLSQLEQIPSDLMFTHGDRIPRYPYRWAPLHLLEYKDNYVLIPAATPERPSGVRTDRGLLVQLDSFKLYTEHEYVPNGQVIYLSIQETTEDGSPYPVMYRMQIAASNPLTSPSWRRGKTYPVLARESAPAQCLYLLFGPSGVQGAPADAEPGNVGLIVERVSEEDDCAYCTPLDTVVVFKMPGSSSVKPGLVNNDRFTAWNAEELGEGIYCVG
jgi:hypothetical protein